MSIAHTSALWRYIMIRDGDTSFGVSGWGLGRLLDAAGWVHFPRADGDGHNTLSPPTALHSAPWSSNVLPLLLWVMLAML